jgi:hypothetical protein
VGVEKFRQPICAINEVDEEPFPSIVYLHASVAGEGVCLEMEPDFLAGCACGGDVEPSEHSRAKAAPAPRRRTRHSDGGGGESSGAGASKANGATDAPGGGGGDADATGTGATAGKAGSPPLWCSLAGGCSCCHEQQVQSGGIVYDGRGRLREDSGYVPGNPIYECNAACACPYTCSNRVVQRGISTRLQVFKTRFKGWAVRPLQRIPAGTFVCEYVGEVITTDEAERRGVEYDKSGFSTLFDLDEAGVDTCEYTIDATYRCGVARFLNHSCSPNMVQTSVWVDTASLSLPRIAFYATRDIEPLEELSFDYKYEEGKGTLECHCGSPNCRKWLY